MYGKTSDQNMGRPIITATMTTKGQKHWSRNRVSFMGRQDMSGATAMSASRRMPNGAMNRSKKGGPTVTRVS